MSGARSLQRQRRSPRATAATPSSTAPPMPSSCMAASASPGNTMRTCTSSARAPRRRCSAAPPGSASGWCGASPRVRSRRRSSRRWRSRMKLGFTAKEERFRAGAAAWLGAQLSGPFADLRGLTQQGGLPGRRREWERALGAARWSCIGWPEAYGGRDASLAEQVIFAEEYARAGAPGRLGYMGVELAGPTILAFGTDEQKRRFLPPIARGEELWCQGYSEPAAGSDLANVRTRAVLEADSSGGRAWVVNGQ